MDNEKFDENSKEMQIIELEVATQLFETRKALEQTKAVLNFTLLALTEALNHDDTSRITK